MTDRALGILFIAAGAGVAGGGFVLARRFRAAATHDGIGRGGHGPFAGLLGLLGMALVLLGLCAALVGAMIGFG